MASTPTGRCGCRPAASSSSTSCDGAWTEAEEDLEALVDLDIRIRVAVARASHNRLLLQTVESMAHALGGFVRTGVESMERARHADPPQSRARMDQQLRDAVATYVAAGQVETNR